MKTPPPTSSQNENSGGLEAWLSDPRAAEFFGEAFALKFEILAGLLQDKCNLAEIGRRHGVGRAAASKQATRAKKIFGLLKPS